MGGVGSGSKPRKYPPEVVELVCGMYQQGMTVAEIRMAAPRGYRVQTILERYLPERRQAGPRDQSGNRNPMWRGDDASYGAIHLRLGKASDQTCTDCGAQANDWSYEGGCPSEKHADGPPFCTHREHYRPRCTRCHHHYDFKGRRPNGQMVSRQEAVRHG